MVVVLLNWHQHYFDTAKPCRRFFFSFPNCLNMSTDSEPVEEQTTPLDTVAPSGTPVSIVPEKQVPAASEANADNTAGEDVEQPAAKPAIRIGSQRDAAAPVAKPAAVQVAIANPIQLVEQETPPEEVLPDAKVKSTAGLGEDIDAEIEAMLGDISMDDVVATTSAEESELEPGTRLAGVVARVHGENVFFKLKNQFEGIVSAAHFKELPETGASVDVIVRDRNKEDGLYELAIPGAAISVADWDDINESDVVEAVVSAVNSGGLEATVNKLRGFIPASQVERFRVENLEEYVGKKLQCIVMEVNPEKKKLVLSRRSLLDRENEAKRAELMKTIEVGQLHDGIVTKLMDFGAFIDIGGLEGLAHISKLSWSRVDHPRDVLAEGQKVQVKIDKFDQDTGKMSLSYRDTLEDPWAKIHDTFQVNDEVKGTVTRIVQFGAFVRLDNQIEGLVHISELAHRRVVAVKNVVTEDDEVAVKILSIDPESQKMGLSIKATQQAPVKKAAKKAGAEEEDVPLRPLAVPKRDEPLQGGLGRKSGGEDVGLNW